MKHTLGRVGLLLFFLYFSILTLFAEDFTYEIHASTHEVYMHEPLQLTVDIEQTNPDAVLLFQFTIDESPDYLVKPLSMKNQTMLHHVKQHTVYEIYPLKEGEIAIHFTLIKRVTTDDKVRYFASGDRDDFKKLETIDYPITVPDTLIHVKALPKGTTLVGDFRLDYHIKTHTANAYEALPLQIILQGTGYVPLVEEIVPKSRHFTRFTEKPHIQSKTTPEGSYHTVTYPIALSAKESFTLAPITLRAFNPKTAHAYTLTIPKQSFKISPVAQEELLDTIDTPAPLAVDFQWLIERFSYLVVFLAGFLTAYLWRWQKKSSKQREHPLPDPLVEKIKDTASSKALLQLLMATDAQHFAPLIETLENAHYKDAKIKLSKVKKEAIDLLCIQK